MDTSPKRDAYLKAVREQLAQLSAPIAWDAGQDPEGRSKTDGFRIGAVSMPRFIIERFMGDPVFERECVRLADDFACEIIPMNKEWLFLQRRKRRLPQAES